MFKRIFTRILCGVMIFGAMAAVFSGCARDELGNKYSSVTKGLDAANAAVDEAKEKSDLISDIDYDIAILVNVEYSSKKYEYGYKNSYVATGRNTDESEIYCSKSLYGVYGNDVLAYYRHNGKIYTEFCDTIVSAPISEKEFYDHVKGTAYTADLSFFDTENFSAGRVYEYSDGTRAAVFTQHSENLIKSIKECFVFDSTYVCEFSDVYLRVQIDAEGEVSECRLDFMLDYYKADAPEDVMTYDGNFACTVNGTGEGVNVRKPQSGVEYLYISDFSNLELLTKGYENLASYTALSVDINRTVVNADYYNWYQLKNEITVTQSYLDKVYKYGSIDVENSETKKRDKDTGEITQENSVSSVGIFALDGKYYYRDLEGNDETKDDTATVEDRILGFADTVMVEAFVGDGDIVLKEISEEDGVITFTYSYSEEYKSQYAVRLLAMMAGGNVNVGNQIVTVMKNHGVVKVRVSDGCLIYHSVEFEANIGYSIDVSGSFELSVNEIGENVDVLDLYDWEKHEMRYN